MYPRSLQDVGAESMEWISNTHAEYCPQQHEALLALYHLYTGEGVGHETCGNVLHKSIKMIKDDYSDSRCYGCNAFVTRKKCQVFLNLSPLAKHEEIITFRLINDIEGWAGYAHNYWSASLCSTCVELVKRKTINFNWSRTILLDRVGKDLLPIILGFLSPIVRQTCCEYCPKEQIFLCTTSFGRILNDFFYD